MAKFRKRPVEIIVEAQQFDPNQPCGEWPLGVEWESPFLDQDGSRLGGYYKLTLVGGFAFVNAGDWIVSLDGQRAVMRDKDFQATYEPVEGGPERNR